MEGISASAAHLSFNRIPSNGRDVSFEAEGLSVFRDRSLSSSDSQNCR
jgi:hypothetical protein